MSMVPHTQLADPTDPANPIDLAGLLSDVRHGLSQPLMVISLSAASLQMRLTDAGLLANVQRIGRSSAALQDMIDDLMIISGILGGTVKPDPKLVAWSEVLRDAGQLCGTDGEHLALHIDDPTAGTQTVRTDTKLFFYLLRSVGALLVNSDAPILCARVDCEGLRLQARSPNGRADGNCETDNAADNNEPGRSGRFQMAKWLAWLIGLNLVVETSEPPSVLLSALRA